MIRRDDSDGIATLRLEHGKANAIDLALFEALDAQLVALAADREVRAVVLTGSGTVFSAGVDLFQVRREGPAYLAAFLPALSRTLRRLFTLPKPLVTAVDGHAIAGGCVVAATGDHAVAAQGDGKLGLTELRVGVPFPTLVLEVMRYRLGDLWLRRLVYGARLLSIDEALEAGLLDEAVPAEALPARAREVARQLGAIPAESFALTKHQLRQPTLAAVDGALAEHDQEAAAVWSSPAALERIGRFLDRTVGKGS